MAKSLSTSPRFLICLVFGLLSIWGSPDNTASAQFFARKTTGVSSAQATSHHGWTAPQGFVPSNDPPITYKQARRFDVMDTTGRGLLHYRKIMSQGVTPQPYELTGQWKGVNRGVVEIAGFNQFIKEIQYKDGHLVGDNIQVKQVPSGKVRQQGWHPLPAPQNGRYQPDAVKRVGKYAVQPPNNRGHFGNAVILSYRDGGNAKNDPARVLVDRVVKIDDNHMVGRAVANLGIVRIPISYFVLERVK